MSQDFVLKVKIQLAKYGKSQGWLADTIGISRPYMSDILTGKRKPDKQIKPIENALNALKEGED
ncbi:MULTISPECIES: helix-turn-helix transcriptional regulator [Enterococcus]|uniref:helix-turn-helix transcriptional regulator n=1 Tax=Enterococcus TaxID=1350 RepID=UPI002090C32B|nr:helix-turn-helix transcriptional regulator [Enterococcus innesii]MCO5497692.1 helix-turn-helix transcriptional regulator [Enterococcus innesii]MEC5315685.1 helix-turn-helix transcriptional regulator [Enterococcus casseliflavus]